MNRTLRGRRAAGVCCERMHANPLQRSLSCPLPHSHCTARRNCSQCQTGRGRFRNDFGVVDLSKSQESEREGKKRAESGAEGNSGGGGGEGGKKDCGRTCAIHLQVVGAPYCPLLPETI